MFLFTSDFWRDVVVSVLSTLIASFVLFCIAQAPPVFRHLKEIAVELDAAARDPEIVLPLTRHYIARGEYARAIAVSEDLAASSKTGAGAPLRDLRRTAEIKLGRDAETYTA